ncbi:hypothetical protein C8034_v003731 [Colletotrichum sidae]|uniref:Uncharacterized protein n=1 Tax=Colletotrichum sidae TaxID=1347389 RepID=A0A4R8T9P3_9PEZI|nr:hypothetical protein C8034_v003731 [Colletotrichum sidae]
MFDVRPQRIRYNASVFYSVNTLPPPAGFAHVPSTRDVQAPLEENSVPCPGTRPPFVLVPNYLLTIHHAPRKEPAPGQEEQGRSNRDEEPISASISEGRATNGTGSHRTGGDGQAKQGRLTKVRIT